MGLLFRRRNRAVGERGVSGKIAFLLVLGLTPSFLITALLIVPFPGIPVGVFLWLWIGVLFAQFVFSPAVLFVFLDSIRLRLRRPGLIFKVEAASFGASSVIFFLFLHGNHIDVSRPVHYRSLLPAVHLSVNRRTRCRGVW
jgi:hypothetical protein